MQSIIYTAYKQERHCHGTELKPLSYITPHLSQNPLIHTNLSYFLGLSRDDGFHLIFPHHCTSYNKCVSCNASARVRLEFNYWVFKT